MLKLLRTVTKPDLEQLGFRVTSDLTSLDPDHFAKVVKFPISPCKDCPQKEKITEINCDRTCERYLRYASTLASRQKEFDQLRDRASVEKLTNIRYVVTDKYGEENNVMTVDPFTYTIVGPTDTKMISEYGEMLYKLIAKGYVSDDDTSSASTSDGLVSCLSIRNLKSLVDQIYSYLQTDVMNTTNSFLITSPSQRKFFADSVGKDTKYKCRFRSVLENGTTKEEALLITDDFMLTVHFSAMVSPSNLILIITGKGKSPLDEGSSSIDNFASTVSGLIIKGAYSADMPAKSACLGNVDMLPPLVIVK